MSLWDAVAVAVEALSWIEVEGLNERQAVLRASNQLSMKDPQSLRLSHMMVLECTRRQNQLDKLLSLADLSLTYQTLKAGPRSFARIYTYWTKVRKSGWDETLALLKAGRKVLGWQELAPLEVTFGRMLGFQLADAISDSLENEKIALETFHEDWFVDYCLRVFGRRKALEILRANMSAPPAYVRINSLVEDESKTLKDLDRVGVELKKVRGMRYVYRVLKSGGRLSASESSRNGKIQIQDKSSCLTVLAAKPKPGEVVFDVCAAPGTKTSFLAQLMHNRGGIYAFDLSWKRMEFWKREMKRMNVNVAHPVLADARQTLPIKAQADLVVLDPPCSNSGTFGKTPSAKWRTRPSDFDRFSKIQLDMLRACGDSVKPGGRLVYSTCSISLEENEEVVETFLRLDPRFRLTDVDPDIGEEGMRGLTQCRRLYPHLDESNGYFVAVMSREVY